MSEERDGRPRMLSFNQVAKRLSSVLSLLADLPQRALTKYRRYVAARLGQPSGRLRATAIHDFMIDELRALVGDALFFNKGRWLLRGEGIVVQFKKMDSAGRTSNYPTDGARAFNTQLDLPGLESAMRITLGYRLDKTNTEVVDVALLARDGEQLLWRESLLDSGQLSLIVPLRGKESRPTPQKLAAKKEAREARGVTKKDKKTEEN